jgi:hypothetical protein
MKPSPIQKEPQMNNVIILGIALNVVDRMKAKGKKTNALTMIKAIKEVQRLHKCNSSWSAEEVEDLAKFYMC